MSKYDNELRSIQQQYLAILQNFSTDVDDSEFYYKAVSIIDKCESFWMSKRLEISIILENISVNEKCFLLSGAIYLNIAGNGHYEFGAIGDRHIINDPILRMKGFFKNKGIVTQEIKEYFSDAITDTISVLTDYSEYFIVISMDSLVSSDIDENLKLGKKLYWDVLSSAFHRNIQSLEELRKEYSTLKEIENALGGAENRFIFNDLSDVELSLENRVKKWFSNNNQMMRMDISNEIDQFFIASMAQIQQAYDILLKCLRFNLFPFIRFEVSIQYFILIAGAFSDDDELVERIEYALVSYLFTNYVIPDTIDKVDFHRYYQLCKKKHLGNIFRDCFFSTGFSFSSFDLKTATSTMMELFSKLIQSELS